ncbi:MAG: MarR family transcriptional regulator [Armatimonadetes bacterium]|nr:MarR family transcriptional regulator [Armatimonadota bacterium]
MSRQVALHNPALMSDEELEATFVAREALLQDVLAGLRERAGKPVNQSLLIVGPRGIGKTNFLHMIRGRLLADDELRRAYLPLLFPEETYAITSARDLFCEVLRVLVEETHSEAARETHERVRDDTDDERARETAIEALRGFRAATGRKLLVMLENLDLLLGDQITDQTDVSRIRDVLMNEGFLALIATSPTHFRQVNGYDQPLYEFFRLIDLGELARAEAEDLLRKRAEFEGNTDFLARFDEYAKRLPAIRRLTGGNPRLILMLYTVFCQTALVEVCAALQALLDDLTPYYKARIEVLSPQQRKVLEAFAREGKPLTPTEIARSSNLAPAQVSTMLSRLQEAGFVELAEQRRRRRRLYVVSERMFRIWHQMRTSPAGRRRMRFLVEFISLWYSGEGAWLESGQLVRSMLDDLAHQQRRAASEKAEYLGYLVAGVADVEAALDIGERAVRACIGGGQCEEAEGLLAEALARARKEGTPQQVAQVHFLRAWLHSVEGQSEAEIDALAACVAANPSRDDAWHNWGLALCRRADALLRVDRHRSATLYEEAGAKYARAVDANPDLHEAWYNWGRALSEWALTLLPTRPEQAPGLFGEAAAKYARAVEVRPDKDEAWYNWGNTLLQLAQAVLPSDRKRALRFCEEAGAVYARAVGVRPEKDEAWTNWGTALLLSAEVVLATDRERALGLYEEAGTRYAEAVKVKPDEDEAWTNWGTALCLWAHALLSVDREGALGLYEEASRRYARAVEIAPHDHQAWYNWSLALQQSARAARGEAGCRFAVEAVDRARRALSLACAAQGTEIRDCSVRLSRALVERGRLELVAGNLGSAQTALREALGPDLLTQGERRFAATWLAREFLEETTAGFFRQVLADLREQGLGEDAEALAPIEAAVEYWQRGGDEAVLERLNPEVREITEEIVRRGERSEGERGDDRGGC